jgi:hypothetical protein
MDVMQFDRDNVSFTAKGEVDEVEKRLLRNHRSRRKAAKMIDCCVPFLH